MPLLLREKDRLRLLGMFSAVPMPIEVWAYGSRVNGKAHEGSDLDLVIRTETLDPLPLAVLTNLVETIRKSNIPILVEVRDWARIPESFHPNILRQHEVMFSNLPADRNEV